MLDVDIGKAKQASIPPACNGRAVSQNGVDVLKAGKGAKENAWSPLCKTLSFFWARKTI